MERIVVNWINIKARLLCVALVALLAGCAAGGAPEEISDPYEANNRAIHKFNRTLDSALLRPASTKYARSAPGPLREGVRNFSNNLSLPGQVVNHLLQFRIEEAGADTFRFLVNTTFGLAGVLDIATEAGIARKPTDFGETLYRWGAGEGAYLELPFLGPSTTRAAIGRVVDTVTDPMNFVLAGSDRVLATGSNLLTRVDDRYEVRNLVDPILYESADSYAQTRLLYLQNRRFQLSGETAPDEFDPYEDVYGLED